MQKEINMCRDPESLYQYAEHHMNHAHILLSPAQDRFHRILMYFSMELTCRVIPVTVKANDE